MYISGVFDRVRKREDGLDPGRNTGYICPAQDRILPKTYSHKTPLTQLLMNITTSPSRRILAGFLLPVLCMLLTASLHGQNIQLGSGNVITSPKDASPVNIWYRSLHCQVLYTASEINAAGKSGAGTLSKFGFFMEGSPVYSLPNFTIRMKHTTAGDVSSEDTVSMQTVYYTPSYSPSGYGFDLLNLSPAFSWNGTDNILLDICFDQVTNYDPSGRLRIYNSPVTNGFRYVRLDAASQCGVVTTTVSGQKPQCRMIFTPLPSADVALLGVDTPFSACGLTNSELVSVGVANLGNAGQGSVNISYRIDNNTPVTEAMGFISVGQSFNYSFSTPADLSAPGTHTIKAWTSLAGDLNTMNDTVVKTVENVNPQAVWPINYHYGFEPADDNAGWKTLDGNRDGSSWVVNTTGSAHTGTRYVKYSTNCTMDADDWWFSRCFQLDTGRVYRASFWYRSGTGSAENLMLKIGVAPDTLYMNDTLINLSGVSNTQYSEAAQNFIVQAPGTYYLGWHAYSPACQGFLYLDDVEISSVHPGDAGVVDVNPPAPAVCGYSASEPVTVSIRNYGLDSVYNVPVSFRADGGAIVSETFPGTIYSGNTATYTFTGTADLSGPGLHHIKAWTDLTGDGNSNNDSIYLPFDNLTPIDIYTSSYTEGFEGAGTGWRAVNADTNIPLWTKESVPSKAHSGSSLMTSPGNPDGTYVEHWLLSRCFQLDAGKNYIIDFWYKAGAPYNAQNLQLRIGASQDTAAMTTLIHDLGFLNDTAWNLSSDTITVGSSGVCYFAWEANGSGAFNSISIDDVHIYGTSPLANFSGTPNSMCPGGNVTYTDLSTNAAASWSWSFPGGSPATTAAQNPVVTYSASGTYDATLVASNIYGADTLLLSNYIVVNPSPSAYAGADTAFCQGFSHVIGGSPAASGGSGSSYSYTWTSSPAGFSSTLANPSHAPSANTSYFLTVTDSAGCQAYDTVLVTVNSLPPANAGADQSICQGGSASLNGTGGTSYLWTPSGGLSCTTCANPSAMPAVTTTYTLTAANASGCSSTDTVIVTVNNNPTPAITPGGPTTFCGGGSLNLSSSAASTYLWSPGGATTQSINVTSSGSYYVTVSDVNGCTGISPSTNVTVNPAPVANAGADVSICNGASASIGGAPSVSGGTAPYSYSWTSLPAGFSSTLANPNVTPASTTTYVLAVSDNLGCSSTDTILVTVNTPTTPAITPGGPTTFCSGGSVVLTASSGSSYLWSNSATTQSITVSASGSFTVDVTDINGCVATSAAEVITVNLVPLAGFTYGINGLSVAFNNTSSGASTYQWDFGDGGASSSANPIHSYSTGGSYTAMLIAYSGSGCSDTISTIVSITTHIISGTVYNQTYSSAVNAGMVFLIVNDSTNTAMSKYDSTAIGAGGTYTFSAVVTDNYLILAEPDKIAYPLSIPTYYGDTAFWVNAKILSVVSDTSGIDIGVREAISPLGPGTISGIVVEGAFKMMGPGDPLGGINTSLVSKSTGIPVMSDVTDSAGPTKGIFYFSNVPVGSYYLWVDVTGVPVDTSVLSKTFDVTTSDTLFNSVIITIDSSLIFVDNFSAVHEIAESDGMSLSSVYPNPAGDHISIEMLYDREEPGTIRFQVSDVTGRKVLQTSNFTLVKGVQRYSMDVSSISGGVYILSYLKGNAAPVPLSRLSVVR